MALTRKQIEKLRARDPYCVHCGDDSSLVPHHRRNRQSGGSKLLDRLDNLMMICAEYNGLMESDANVAQQARDLGHKLNSWSDFSTPMFDRFSMNWYELDEQGGKTVTDPPSYLI